MRKYHVCHSASHYELFSETFSSQQERLEELEVRLENFLNQMTEDVALDFQREQQHLMLMQDQVHNVPI